MRRRTDRYAVRAGARWLRREGAIAGGRASAAAGDSRATGQAYVTDWDEFTGRFEAIEEVQVRARVGGFVNSVEFKDGAIVHAGDLLYIIDPRPFEAVAMQAHGQLDDARAKAELAKRELDRGLNLVQTSAVSEQVVDQRRQALQAAHAAETQAEGALKAAQLNVEFTHVLAPITGRVSRHLVMLVIYLALIGSAGWLLATTPQGFIPAQDRGYLIISAQLPGAASLARTTAVVREIERIALDTPGIVRVAAFAGFSGATRTQAGNAAALFPVFDEPEARLKKGLSANAITAELRKRLSVIQGAFIIVIPPPAVPGIGTGGGFAIRIQDRQGRGPELLAAATDELVAAARKSPNLTSVFSPYSANTPQLFVDIDRVKAQKLGVPIANVTDTIETYFGSTYVNDFNLFGRTYHVTAQADLPFRKETSDLARLRTRNAAGDMVMLGSVVDFKDISGPDRVARYNLYPASELQGEPAPGVSSTTALNTIKQLADETLPSGFSFEWTDLSYQQVTGGNAGLYVFPICVLFVYLVLAAQYGSWTLPFAVILIVPMCLFAATIGVRIMGQDVNILTQIGFVVLVGLAAKNAILIVEFARDIELEGRSRLEAVIEACRLRLRPILMTSFAFILGVLPLVVSTGSGSEMRQAVGVAVFFGMLGVTLFGLIFTPIFYMVVRNLAEGKNEGKPTQMTAAAAG